MNVRAIRFIFWLTTAGCAAGAICCWVFVLNRPPTTDATRAQGYVVHVSTETPGQPTQVAASDLRQVAQVNLRRALHDPPPPALPPPPPAVVVPPINIHLAGTIFEPGHCRALIQMPDGTTQLKSVGDTAGEARILKIEDGQITVQYTGHLQVLTVVKKKS